MTCIVAVKDEKAGTVILGADSAGAEPDGGYVAPFLTRKLFTKGPYIIGFSGAYTFGQGVKAMHLPYPPPFATLSQFMEGAFRQALIDQSLDFLPEPNKDGSLVVAIKGSIFYVEGDYGILEPISSYFAMGGGSDYAYGSLYTSQDCQTKDTQERATLALMAAAMFNPGSVCAPFHFLETSP